MHDGKGLWVFHIEKECLFVAEADEFTAQRHPRPFSKEELKVDETMLVNAEKLFVVCVSTTPFGRASTVHSVNLYWSKCIAVSSL